MFENRGSFSNDDLPDWVFFITNKNQLDECGNNFL